METQILLGTYTRRDSEGIYQITLETEKAELSALTLMTKENSPTYLAESAAGNLYSVTAVDGEGGCAAYDPAFHFLNAVTKPGAPLCYVAVDEARQLVYGANYHKGEVTVYQIHPDGSLVLADSLIHTEPTGSHENQDGPHVHYTDLTPDGRLAVCDLGTDRVYTYDVSVDGKLTEVAVYHTPDGTGPRHLVFHPNQRFAYLFCELASTVNVLAYDATDGSFTHLQELSSIPPGYTDFNSGAAIRLSQDGKFLYASNRGHNSIAVYQVNDAGDHLEQIQSISTEGDFPRDFALDPSDEFVVCANQNSDNLTLYRRDQATGQLTLLQKDVYAPECVCVLFK